MNYWCAYCQKEVPASEVKQLSHIGAMHTACGSGRVSPMPEEKDARPVPAE